MLSLISRLLSSQLIPGLLTFMKATETFPLHLRLQFQNFMRCERDVGQKQKVIVFQHREPKVPLWKDNLLLRPNVPEFNGITSLKGAHPVSTENHIDPGVRGKETPFQLPHSH